ncbi:MULTISPECIES: hypothetical protein [unclassified Streptomyces]|uniref:hypothetical protein n=1 Tax=unclassified Streptomyces TaxID=2593676 RepID=UPI00278C5D3E|nr:MULTISPECIES: hypothetical protein [unclassified Streptomyces]
MSAAQPVEPRTRSLPARRRTSSLVLRALLTGLAALLGAAVLPPGAALADEGSEARGLTATETFRVAPYGGKPRPDREKRILVNYDRGTTSGGAHNSTLTMDVTDSSDVLRLKKYGNGCSGTDWKIVCRVGEPYDSWTDWAGALPRAAPTSKPGDKGELHIAFRDGKGRVSRATTHIEVGGPVLALRKLEPFRMKPGSERAAALDVRNTGELPADGFTVTATVDKQLGPVRRSRSCDYRSHGDTTTVTCGFPHTRLEPGEAAHVPNWLDLRSSHGLMYATFRATAQLVGTGADNGGLDGSSRSTSSPAPSGTPHKGTGPALAPQVREATGDSDEYSEDTDVWTKVRVANHPDYALVSKLSAGDGDGRRLQVGMRNNGPGDPQAASGGGGGSSLVLTFPEGTDVRKEPMEEIDDDVFDPVCRHRGLTYTCPLDPVGLDKSAYLDFEVRKDEGKGKGADDGTVAKAALKPGDTGADHADHDPSNNTRAIDLFGPVADKTVSSDSKTSAGVVAGGVIGGCVALGGAALLVRRKLRGR